MYRVSRLWHRHNLVQIFRGVDSVARNDERLARQPRRARTRALVHQLDSDSVGRAFPPARKLPVISERERAPKKVSSLKRGPPITAAGEGVPTKWDSSRSDFGHGSTFKSRQPEPDFLLLRNELCQSTNSHLLRLGPWKMLPLVSPHHTHTLMATRKRDGFADLPRPPRTSIYFGSFI